MTADDTRDLRELRAAIDEVDEAITDLVVERLRLAEEVAAVKADANRALVDEDREETVVAQYAEAFEEMGLEAERGETLARFLIETALEAERRAE